MIKYFLIIYLFVPLIAFSKEHVVEVNEGKIIFTTAKEEKSQRHFFGADLWFTGKTQNGKRNVMSILYNSKDVELNPQVTDKEFAAHKKQMLEFAKKRSYSNVDFKPYQFIKISENLAYHQFVWSYVKAGEKFTEQSYYVECNGLFFIAKATTFSDALSDQEKFKNIVETARCTK